MTPLLRWTSLTCMLLINLLAAGVGTAYGYLKVPDNPDDFLYVKKGSTFRLDVGGATEGMLPEGTEAYTFDLFFNPIIVELELAQDRLVGGVPTDVSPILGGVQVAALGTTASPQELIASLWFRAIEFGATGVEVGSLVYYVPNDPPDGNLQPLAQPPMAMSYMDIFVVPEPATISLAASGLLAMAWVAARRGRRRG